MTVTRAAVPENAGLLHSSSLRNERLLPRAQLVRLLLYFVAAAESRPRKDTMPTLNRSLLLAGIFPVLISALGLAGCATAALSPQGAQVAVTRNPPTPDCVTAGYLVGEGGGTFGGSGSRTTRCSNTR